MTFTIHLTVTSRILIDVDYNVTNCCDKCSKVMFISITVCYIYFNFMFDRNLLINDWFFYCYDVIRVIKMFSKSSPLTNRLETCIFEAFRLINK